MTEWAAASSRPRRRAPARPPRLPRRYRYRRRTNRAPPGHPKRLPLLTPGFFWDTSVRLSRVRRQYPGFDGFRSQLRLLLLRGHLLLARLAAAPRHAIVSSRLLMRSRACSRARSATRVRSRHSSPDFRASARSSSATRPAAGSDSGVRDDATGSAALPACISTLPLGVREKGSSRSSSLTAFLGRLVPFEAATLSMMRMTTTITASMMGMTRARCRRPSRRARGGRRRRTRAL